MKRIMIVYDCPEETCDKAWLYESVQQSFPQVKVIYAKRTLSRLWNRNKLKYIIFLIDLLIRSVKQSAEADTIIIWGKSHAILLNVYFRIFKPNIKILSFNWLTPSHRKRAIVGWALTNPKFVAIVNDKTSISLYQKQYNLPHTHNFCYLPDVYDTHTPFVSDNIHTPQSPYFFTGGMNNRDFGLILKVARKFPYYQFVIIALRQSWHFKSHDIPSNVSVKFNTTPKEYYDTMKKARAVLLPLLDNRVAGLINIAKAIQYGTLCIVSCTPSSKIYFDNPAYLIEIGNLESLQQAIKRIDSLTPIQYQQEVLSLQNYLKNNFAPHIIVKQLLLFATKYFSALESSSQT